MMNKKITILKEIYSNLTLSDLEDLRKKIIKI